LAGLCFLVILWQAIAPFAARAGEKTSGTWPQAYSVEKDDASGLLTLRTAFYTVEHDLKRGGAISRISLVHGKAANLLASPVEARIKAERGAALTDLKDSAPKIAHRRAGGSEVVSVECVLAGENGETTNIRLKTTYEYRWGYIKIHRELLLPDGGLRAREVCPVSFVLAPSLTEYGYREGTAEEEGAQPFSYGSSVWGKLGSAGFPDQPLEIPCVPRSMIFVDPGVEGLEWFVGSDLAQWELWPAGIRGRGRCLLRRSHDPLGQALSVSPLWSENAATALTKNPAFDFYIGFPVIEGHARKPWIHTSFNRNRGQWLSTEEIRRMAEKGYTSVHCHNDGDYYGDGLFWRDGSYPPYPDMEGYDKVLRDCRRFGIRTATYFSNKELHPGTREFREHGEEWARKDLKGGMQHNFYREQSEFGAQMCLRSGWLEFLKFSIDRVLKNHPLDGVYYDWNVALLCRNPLHEGGDAQAPSKGHWDIDELLDLMEWTRRRVGRDGLVIIHNTKVPMFAAENFADYVVATEWGYGKWTDGAPAPRELPLEWSLAGARPRGVISYGMIDGKAPRRLHKLFAMEAFLGGVAPWPASPETFELLPLLDLPGGIESYTFADWRNPAVSLSDPLCASAVYSRPGEAYLLLANFDKTAREVTCALKPEKLPFPISRPRVARLGTGPAGSDSGRPAVLELDADQLTQKGVKITIPGDHVLVIQIR